VPTGKGEQAVDAPPPDMWVVHDGARKAVDQRRSGLREPDGAHELPGAESP
jgi:hypothetical protein